MDVFEQFFRTADLDGDGKISGSEAVSFFQGSGLPQIALAKIWQYADQRQSGFLSRPEFVNALKLVTVAQTGRELTPEVVRAALSGPAASQIPPPRIQLSSQHQQHQQRLQAASFGSQGPPSLGRGGPQPQQQFPTGQYGRPGQPGSFGSTVPQQPGLQQPLPFRGQPQQGPGGTLGGGPASQFRAGPPQQPQPGGAGQLSSFAALPSRAPAPAVAAPAPVPMEAPSDLDGVSSAAKAAGLGKPKEQTAFAEFGEIAFKSTGSKQPLSQQLRSSTATAAAQKSQPLARMKQSSQLQQQGPAPGQAAPRAPHQSAPPSGLPAVAASGFPAGAGFAGTQAPTGSSARPTPAAPTALGAPAGFQPSSFGAFGDDAPFSVSAPVAPAAPAPPPAAAPPAASFQQPGPAAPAPTPAPLPSNKNETSFLFSGSSEPSHPAGAAPAPPPPAEDFFGDSSDPFSAQPIATASSVATKAPTAGAAVLPPSSASQAPTSPAVPENQAPAVGAVPAASVSTSPIDDMFGDSGAFSAAAPPAPSAASSFADGTASSTSKPAAATSRAAGVVSEGGSAGPNRALDFSADFSSDPSKPAEHVSASGGDLLGGRTAVGNTGATQVSAAVAAPAAAPVAAKPAEPKPKKDAGAAAAAALDAFVHYGPNRTPMAPSSAPTSAPSFPPPAAAPSYPPPAAAPAPPPPAAAAGAATSGGGSARGPLPPAAAAAASEVSAAYAFVEGDSVPWPRISVPEAQRYTQIFAQIDTDRDGKISGEQARKLLMGLQVPIEVLKRVWDLSDADEDGMLTLREFCTALYLISRFKEGRPVPPSLPRGLHFDETPPPLADPKAAVAAARIAEAQAAIAQNAAGLNVPAWRHDPTVLTAGAPAAPPPAAAPAPVQTTVGQMPTPVSAVDITSAPPVYRSSAPPLEPGKVAQLEPEEQAAIRTKHQEAEAAAKKVWETEAELMDSKRKISFYRTKMQEIIMFKSRCDNKLNEIVEQAAAEKREVDALSKKYDEKYKQTQGLVSRLAFEEKALADLEEKKVTLRTAVMRLDQGGDPNAVLQERADKLALDLEDLRRAVNKRGKELGLTVRPLLGSDMPFGWQAGLQENTMDWDDEWEEFLDEGFNVVRDVGDEPLGEFGEAFPASAYAKAAEAKIAKQQQQAVVEAVPATGGPGTGLFEEEAGHPTGGEGMENGTAGGAAGAGGTATVAAASAGAVTGAAAAAAAAPSFWAEAEEEEVHEVTAVEDGGHDSRVVEEVEEEEEGRGESMHEEESADAPKVEEHVPSPFDDDYFFHDEAPSSAATAANAMQEPSFYQNLTEQSDSSTSFGDNSAAFAGAEGTPQSKFSGGMEQEKGSRLAASPDSFNFGTESAFQTSDSPVSLAADAPTSGAAEPPAAFSLDTGASARSIWSMFEQQEQDEVGEGAFSGSTAGGQPPPKSQPDALAASWESNASESEHTTEVAAPVHRAVSYASGFDEMFQDDAPFTATSDTTHVDGHETNANGGPSTFDSRGFGAGDSFDSSPFHASADAGHASGSASAFDAFGTDFFASQGGHGHGFGEGGVHDDDDMSSVDTPMTGRAQAPDAPWAFH